MWFLFRNTQTGAAQCSSLQQATRQAGHAISPKPTCHPGNFGSEAELAGCAWFLLRNTQTGAAQCSSCAHHYGKPDKKHDTTTAIFRQKQNWLVMCGFSSETLRLERHSAHHCSRRHVKQAMRSAQNRHVICRTSHQKQNWLVMRGFSSETLRLERHSAHHVLIEGKLDKTHDTITAAIFRQKQNWLILCGFSSETLRLERHSAHHYSRQHFKQHARTALNRHVIRANLRQKQNWLVMRGFSSETLRLERHSAHHVLINGKLDKTHDTITDAIFRQKQNWLVMCGFSSETLRLERHSAHHYSRQHFKQHARTALNRHVICITLHQKQNWLVMRGFSSETLRLERHSAHHVLINGKPDKKHDTITDAIFRQKQNWLVMCGFSSETLRLERHSAHHYSRQHFKQHARTALNRHVICITLHQKQNWLVMRGFSSETLRLERHSAHHVLINGKLDKTHDTITDAIFRQKQNWLVMCGFSSETLRLERHSAHHYSRQHLKQHARTALNRHVICITLHQKQNWPVMRGFSSETLRLERHSAHHYSRQHFKQHARTALNRHAIRTIFLIRSRTGWLCGVSPQNHSDWTVLIIAAAGLDFRAT